MITLKGIPASPGIAIGPAYMVSSEGTSLEKKKIPSTNIEWEVRRYQEALRLTYDDLTKPNQMPRNFLVKILPN